MRAGSIRAAVLGAALAAAAPAAAAGDVPEEWWVFVDGTGGPAVRVEESHPHGGGLFGFRLTLFRRGLALGTGVEAGPGLSGPDSRDVLSFAGAGIVRSAGPRTRLYALGLAGMHLVEVEERDGPGWHRHALPAAAARIGAVRGAGDVIFVSWGVSATVAVDLARERDVFLGRKVGGVTAVLSLSLGFGLYGRTGEAVPAPPPDPE